MIKLRTKIEIIGAVLIFLILLANGLFAVTRTITDTGDTIDTYIRNSKGKYWEATGANIQTAIWDLNSTGGTVWLPGGVLVITNDISMEENVTIIGLGEGRTIISSDYSGAIPIWVQGGDDNCTLRDFTIDMNNNGGNGIYVVGDNIVIDHVEILNAGFQGIYVSGATNSRFTNIHVKHGDSTASHGIGVASSYNCIYDNILVENYDSPEASEDGMDMLNTYNSTVSNFIVEGHGWLDGFKIANTVSNTSFSNIIIDGASGYGIKLQEAQYCNFDNIIIRNSSYLSIYDTTHHCNFNNIMTTNSDDVGINVDGNNLTFNNLQIYYADGGFSFSGNDVCVSNSIIKGCGGYGRLDATNNVIFSNCIFKENTGEANIYVYGTSNFKFINCIFEGNTGDAIDTTTGPCNNYSIIGCTFKNNAQGIDCHANDDWIIISLNQFIGDTLDDHYTTKGYVANNIGDDI